MMTYCQENDIEVTLLMWVHHLVETHFKDAILKA